MRIRLSKHLWLALALLSGCASPRKFTSHPVCWISSASPIVLDCLDASGASWTPDQFTILDMECMPGSDFKIFNEECHK